ESPLYSVHIVLIMAKNSYKFVESNVCKETALRKAAQQVLDFLKCESKAQEKADDLSSDQDLVRIFDELKEMGYEVNQDNRKLIDSNTFSTVYKCTINIPGMGNF